MHWKYTMYRHVLSCFVLCFICISPSESVAVMSVDLGSEWMKIAIVSPGVPMEIALNRESKRKTPVVISFRDNEREIGDGALAVGVRFPEATYTHILHLVGKKLNNPMVTKYQTRFPYHKLAEDPHTGTVVFQKDGQNHFRVEELLSMILHRAREYAQEFAGQVIKDVVITVPVFFNQAERQSVIHAASLANLKVLQLINSNTAVALNYGVFRRKDFNATAQYIMFYDMGASSTTTTIVGYQVAKTKERGFTEINPQLTVLGVGYDRTLGGFEFTLRLRDHLAKLFNSQKKTKTNVETNPRAMAKLLKEAERVKMILSANNDHFAQVENLLDDQDFRALVTRDEFEAMCTDLYDRVGDSVNKALTSAAMTMDSIDQVILVGAGTRIPKVQEKLLQAVGKSELGKNLNTDEAAAMGAVYQAAHLSQGFKVKKFVVKDTVLFPIQVDFEREIDSDKHGKGVKVVSRTLFGLMNPYPLKKAITFNRITSDPFTFYVNYGKIDFSPKDVEIFGSLNLTKVELSGMKAVLDKHTNDDSESKGVKAHFRMDESGILTLDHVESVFEKMEESTVDAESDTESTLSKLGSTISKLFSGGGSDESAPTSEDGKSDAKDESQADAKDEKQSKETSDDAKEKDKEQEKVDTETTKTENITEKQINETLSKENATETKNETKPLTKPKLVTIKEVITFTQKKLDLLEPLEEDVKSSIKKIAEFNKLEKHRKEKEEAKNNLESFILDTQDKLYQPEYEKASTEDEREKIRTELATASEWLYDEGDSAEDASIYRNKLNHLNTFTTELFARVKEHRERPEVLKAMQELINMSEVFLTSVKKLPEDDQYFTEVEMSTLEKLIDETKQWRDKKKEEQSKQPLYEKPVMPIRAVVEKMAILDRELKYLVNKARTAKPKPKKKVNETKDNATAEEDSITKSEEETTSETPATEPTPEPATKASTEETTEKPTPTKEDPTHTEL